MRLLVHGRRLVWAVAFGMLLVGLGPRPATAYEAAAGAWSVSGGTGTLVLPSGVTATVTATGATEVALSKPLSGWSAGDYFTPGVVGADSAVEVRTWMRTCEPTGTCADRGTLTVTFSQPVRNPTLHFAGLGGASWRRSGGVYTHQSDMHATLKLTGGEATITRASGNDNFAVADGVITAANSSASSSCASNIGAANPAAATASCGSAQVAGVVTSLTFDVGGVLVKNPNTPEPAVRTMTAGDGYGLTVTLPQDYSEAPASYNATQAPAHVLSDLTLGAAVAEDKALERGSATGAATDTTDALGPVPAVLAQPGASYRLTVPVAGVSREARLCGYLDLDRSGTFDTAAERACAAVAAGAASATLAWTVPAGAQAGQTWARFRLGYQAAQVESPTGLADSGEVEDYPVQVLARPQVVLTKTTTGSVGGPFSYALTNTTHTAATVTTTTAGAATPVDGDPTTAGVQPFTVAAAGTEVTITETSASGWALVGAACTAADGSPVGRWSGSTYTIPGSAVGPGAVVRCGFTNAEPALTFTKTSSGVTDTDGNGPDAGDSVAYTFVVTNTGRTVLSQVAIADPRVDVTCPRTELAPGEAMTCTAQYLLTQADVTAGTVVNTARVSATPPTGPALTRTSSTTVTVPARPRLTLTKTATAPSAAQPGATIPYQLQLANAGNLPLSAVAVTDPKAGAVACPGTSLAPGETMTCSASYALTQADIDAGQVVNTASATATAPSGATVSATSSVTTLLDRVPDVGQRTNRLPLTGAPVGPAGLGLALGAVAVGLLLTRIGRGRRRG